MPYSDPFTRAPYTGARAIPMVGRQQAVAQIKTLIQQAEKSCLIYLTGIGGIGKTRLIAYLLETLRQEPDLHVASELIDLYHADHATVEGMVSQSVKVLATNESAFAGYYELRSQLNLTRATRPHDKKSIEALREAMLASFISDANTLSRHKRLVIALDTAEKLDLQHSAVAEELGISEGRSETVARLCAAIRDLDNVVVILAGRPSGNYLYDEFSRRLEQRFHHLPLKGLSRTEAGEYFQKVIAQLQESEKSNDQRVADWLLRAQAPPHSIFQALHDDPSHDEEPTVRPIMLALAIDLVVTAPAPTTYEFLRTTAPLSSAERAANRNRLGAEIVGVNRDEPSPDEELILILGWLRKGAAPTLLYQLLRLKYDINQADFDATLANVQRLSFIKKRPTDQRFFLHDEMYDLVQLHGLQAADADRTRVFRNLLSYYADEIQRVRNELSELAQVQAKTSEEKTKISDATIAKLNELRTLLAEEVHYRLRAHAGRGFQHYFRVSEEAVAAHDHPLGALFRAEMEAFVDESKLSQKPAGLEELHYTDVIADEAVRWIEWRHDEGDYKTALKIAETLQDRQQTMIKTGDVLTQAELDSWHGLILTELGRYQEAEFYLERAIKSLLTKTPQALQKTLRWTGILARAYHNLGYMFSNQGRHYRAIEAYNSALPLWRALRMTGEQANTIGNISLKFAEIGDFDSARRFIRDALTLRQQHNLRLLVGYTFSTMAEIDIRAFSSEIAIQEAEQAIVIFAELGHIRGRGMALRALAEAKRRVSGSPATRRERRTLVLLEESADHAKEAVQIFETQITEPIRHVWALLELGCVYRDWLLYRSTNPDELSPREATGEETRLTLEQLYKRGANAFEQAATKAKEIHQLNHRLDALINWIWLLYYRSFDATTGDFRPSAKGLQAELYNQIEEFFSQQYGKRAPQFMQRLTADSEESIVRDDYLIRLGDWESFQGEVKLATDLQAAIEHFAISLACFAHYGNENVRQARRTRNRLYDLLKVFASASLFQVYENVETIEQKFGWSPHTSAIWKFLIDNFGPKEGHIDFELDTGF